VQYIGDEARAYHTEYEKYLLHMQEHSVGARGSRDG
jgi:hypothetical protein